METYKDGVEKATAAQLLDHDIEQEISENAFARVEFDLPYETIESGIEAYLGFCALSSEYTNATACEYPNGKRGSQMGHIVKGKKPGDDPKHYFHYRHGIEDILKPELERKGFEIVPELRSFLNIAREIHDAACDTLYKTMSQLSKHYPFLIEKHFPEHGDWDFYTRFLAYHPTGNSQLARAHHDIGSTTLAIGESHPGLRIGPNKYSLTPVEHEEYTAKFFLAGSWRTLYPDSRLPLGWHDVIQRGDYVDPETARGAVVTFANPEEDVQPTEEEAHTPE